MATNDLTKIKQQVRETTAEVLGMPPGELPEDAGMNTVSAWTSLQHLTVIAAIEAQFGIEMDMDEMTTATTLDALASVVARHQGGI